MQSMRRREFGRYIPWEPNSPAEYTNKRLPDRPLNEAELSVLRAQYEKEGEMVGVQTKFNYAWVRGTLVVRVVDNEA